VEEGQPTVTGRVYRGVQPNPAQKLSEMISATSIFR